MSGRNMCVRGDRGGAKHVCPGQKKRPGNFISRWTCNISPSSWWHRQQRMFAGMQLADSSVESLSDAAEPPTSEAANPSGFAFIHTATAPQLTFTEGPADSLDSPNFGFLREPHTGEGHGPSVASSPAASTSVFSFLNRGDGAAAGHETATLSAIPSTPRAVTSAAVAASTTPVPPVGAPTLVGAAAAGVLEGLGSASGAPRGSPAGSGGGLGALNGLSGLLGGSLGTDPALGGLPLSSAATMGGSGSALGACATLGAEAAAKKKKTSKARKPGWASKDAGPAELASLGSPAAARACGDSSSIDESKLAPDQLSAPATSQLQAAGQPGSHGALPTITHAAAPAVTSGSSIPTAAPTPPAAAATQRLPHGVAGYAASPSLIFSSFPKREANRSAQAENSLGAVASPHSPVVRNGLHSTIASPPGTGTVTPSTGVRAPGAGSGAASTGMPGRGLLDGTVIRVPRGELPAADFCCSQVPAAGSTPTQASQGVSPAGLTSPPAPRAMDGGTPTNRASSSLLSGLTLRTPSSTGAGTHTQCTPGPVRVGTHTRDDTHERLARVSAGGACESACSDANIGRECGRRLEQLDARAGAYDVVQGTRAQPRLVATSATAAAGQAACSAGGTGEGGGRHAGAQGKVGAALSVVSNDSGGEVNGRTAQVYTAIPQGESGGGGGGALEDVSESVRSEKAAEGPPAGCELDEGAAAESSTQQMRSSGEMGLEELEALHSATKALVAERAELAVDVQSLEARRREAERAQQEASNQEDFEAADALEVTLELSREQLDEGARRLAKVDEALHAAEEQLLEKCEAEVHAQQEAATAIIAQRETLLDDLVALRAADRSYASAELERIGVERERLLLDASRLREDTADLDQQVSSPRNPAR